MDLAEIGRQMRIDSEVWFHALHRESVDQELALHYALGLGGEVGEVLNLVKKWNRNPDEEYEALGRSIGLELADVLTYLLLLADQTGVDLETEWRFKREVNAGRWGEVDPLTDFQPQPSGIWYCRAHSGTVNEDEERTVCGWFEHTEECEEPRTAPPHEVDDEDDPSCSPCVWVELEIPA